MTIILGSCLTPESDLLYRHKRKGADLSDPPSYNPAWPKDRPLRIQGLHPCIPWEQNTLSLLPMENSSVRGTQPHTSGRPVLSSVPIKAGLRSTKDITGSPSPFWRLPLYTDVEMECTPQQWSLWTKESWNVAVAGHGVPVSHLLL